MEALDAAVKAFFAADPDDDGMCSGWVLMYNRVQYRSDGDIAYSTGYATSPDCDVPRSVGIVELGRRYMLSDCGIYPRSERDDDG